MPSSILVNVSTVSGIPDWSTLVVTVWDLSPMVLVTVVSSLPDESLTVFFCSIIYLNIKGNVDWEQTNKTSVTYYRLGFLHYKSYENVFLQVFMTLISLKYEIINILVSVGNVLHVPAFLSCLCHIPKLHQKAYVFKS